MILSILYNVHIILYFTNYDTKNTPKNTIKFKVIVVLIKF